MCQIVCDWHLEGQWQEEEDPDPIQNQDQLVRGMYLRIRIHHQISLIQKSNKLRRRITKNDK
jgi:hypothetical protein